MFLVIGWITDNPSVWLICHPRWHTEKGFALQLIERQSEISELVSNEVIDLHRQWKAVNLDQNQYD